MLIDQAPVLQDRIHDGRFLRIPIAGDIAARLANEAGLAIFHRYHSRRWPSPRVGRCSLLDVADELRGELRIEQQRPFAAAD